MSINILYEKVLMKQDREDEYKTYLSNYERYYEQKTKSYFPRKVSS